MTYEAALNWLYTQLPMYQRVGATAFKKDLGNTRTLLEALNNPHEELQFVHVAGTNGKGSSCHMLASCLTAAGLKTGLYTSPHLKSFTERIQVDFQEIPEASVTAFVELIQGLQLDIEPSFFEMTVAMAFWYFKEQQVDIAVIETGLGGRLDSTNVINPVASLITRIGFDHMDLLGDTLELIAEEKAGIIKANVPVVIAVDQPEIADVFRRKAAALEAPFHNKRRFSVELIASSPEGQVLDVKDGKELIYSNLNVGNGARYILDNVPGVLEIIYILRSQGFSISEDAVRHGMADFRLKGRMQIIQKEPLTIADISHNPLGIQSLVQQIKQWHHQRLFIVIGTVKDKNIEETLKLLPDDAIYYFTQSSVPRSLDKNSLMSKAGAVGLRGEPAENVNEAIAKARTVAMKNDFILICGSTFVVAEIENL